jgi:pimeloyl-ACP methyl ester carboxylesterase
MTILFSWNLEHLYRRNSGGDPFHPEAETTIESSEESSSATAAQKIYHPLLGDPDARMADIDKIKPFHDPRVQFRSAHLNGKTYGYLYSPRSPTATNRGTIILVHGFPDLSFGWRYQIPFLTSLGLDVIAPDCMGYGRTDAPPYTLADYTYKRIAADIGSLCSQLSLSSIILGGHDWGGAIVYRLAQYHPQLVKAIFVICTPYSAPRPTYMPLAQQVATLLPNFGYQLHFASGELETECATPHTIRQFLMNLYGARTPDGTFAFSAEKGIDIPRQRQLTTPSRILSEDELSYYVQEYSRHGIRGPLNWYRTQEHNYLNDLDYFFEGGKKTSKEVGVDQETLFVLATKDQALRPWMAAKMGERIKKLSRREVDAGHWCLWERPGEVNKMIGEWLETKVWGVGKGKL